MRQFQQLARMAEADGHLQQRIKQLLKLSKEKWDAACEHAKTAVQVWPPISPNTITVADHSSSSCVLVGAVHAKSWAMLGMKSTCRKAKIAGSWRQCPMLMPESLAFIQIVKGGRTWWRCDMQGNQIGDHRP